MTQSKYDYTTIITALSQTVVFKQMEHPQYKQGPVALKVTAPLPSLSTDKTENEKKEETVKDKKNTTKSSLSGLMTSSMILHEAYIYSLVCPHPSIPNFVECEEDWFDTSRFLDKQYHCGIQRLPVLVTQFVKAASLNRLFHTFSVIHWSVAVQVVYKLALVLEHIHLKGVVYGDLKLPNVLLAGDGHVWLVDFASAMVVCDYSSNNNNNNNNKEEGKEKEKIIKEELARGITLHVRAPELFPSINAENMNNDNSTNSLILQYPFMIDFWAFGAFIIELLSGRPYLRSFDQRSAALTEKELRETILDGFELIKRRYSCSFTSNNSNSNIDNNSNNNNNNNNKSGCGGGTEIPFNENEMWESLQELLVGLLHCNPKERLGFNGGWKTILQHRFFKYTTFEVQQPFPMEYSEEISDLMLGL